jgi:serine/threonine protein phosphatase PrpC
MTAAFRAVGATHTGLRRTGNEDSGYVGRRLLVVADGMGGVEYGEVASAIVTHAVTYLDRCISPEGVAHDLAAAVEFAEYRLARAAERDPGRAGMGTTMTAVLLHADVVALVHVGDSRAYRLRDGLLEQVTRDHTFVQLLVELGELSPEAAEHHPQRHVIVKALQGSGDAVTADVQVQPATPGDRFLLCSDGLSDYVEREQIAQALALPQREQVADALVDLALAAGAPDNVTCVVADVVEGLPVPEDAAPGLLGAATELDPWGHRPAGASEPVHRAT